MQFDQRVFGSAAVVAVWTTICKWLVMNNYCRSNVGSFCAGELCCKLWRSDVWSVVADLSWSQPQCVGVAVRHWQCNTRCNILHKHLSASCTARWRSLSSWCCSLSKRYCWNFCCKLYWSCLAAWMKDATNICMQYSYNNNNNTPVRSVMSTEVMQSEMSMLH